MSQSEPVPRCPVITIKRTHVDVTTFLSEKKKTKQKKKKKKNKTKKQHNWPRGSRVEDPAESEESRKMWKKKEGEAPPWHPTALYPPDLAFA
jgi:hypothetical protein